jgi:hypothetical protein
LVNRNDARDETIDRVLDGQRVLFGYLGQRHTCCGKQRV